MPTPIFRKGIVALATALLALLAPSGAGAYTFGDTVEPLGQEQMVFDYSPNNPNIGTQPRCGGDPFFFQDVPTRAFRDASDRVNLIIGNSGFNPGVDGNRRLLTAPGGSLANLPLTVDCQVLLSSHGSSNPGTFNNWEWLASPYTEDGQTIHALIHNEYHGWEYPGQCTTQNAYDPKCWYNGVTLAKSTNAGASYSHTTAPTHLIATSPYQYEPNAGPEGLFQPSNILKRGSWYYTLVRAEPYRAQAGRGVCALRTQNLDDPTSWRAYDGNAADDNDEGFTVSMVNPYGSMPFVPEQHVCALVSPGTLNVMTGELVYSTYFRQFMVVDQTIRSVNGQPTEGIYYSLSNDLIRWDEPKLLMKAPFAWDYHCGDPDIGIRSVSVLDSNSTDRNFNTVGQNVDLYYVKSHFQTTGTCPETLDRDLVRVPVRFHLKIPQPRWATGWFHGCPGAFDTAVYTQAQSFFFPSGDRNYTGLQYSYKADVSLGGPTTAYGVFNKLREPPGPLCEFNNESNRAPLAVGEGDEIRYSGAYVFPTSGFWDKLGNDGNAANVTFMRLMGGAPGWGAALLVTKDGQIRFNANNGSATTQFLANPETIPKDNCWHFFDVYQKLSSNPAQAVNRLWIDGQERATVSGVNLPANGSYGSIFAGIVQRINASSVILYNDMVGFGYGVPLYYIGCRGVDDNYPTG